MNLFEGRNMPKTNNAVARVVNEAVTVVTAHASTDQLRDRLSEVLVPALEGSLVSEREIQEILHAASNLLNRHDILGFDFGLMDSEVAIRSILDVTTPYKKK